ncbi:hypothetical protein AQ1_02448 [alpha proteobacterium Q-1]|nr:hypothetical protein AQ1_02448 [alpha proteobacterium Q-1]
MNVFHNSKNQIKDIFPYFISGIFYYVIYLVIFSIFGFIGDEFKNLPFITFISFLYNLLYYDLGKGLSFFSFGALKASFISFACSFTLGKMIWIVIQMAF